MTIFRNTAEGGTNGAGVTLGNSGGVSGTAMRTNITGAGSTLTYDNASASQGARGFLHQWVAGGQSCLRIPAGVSSTDWAQSFDFRFNGSLPASGSHEIVMVQNSAADVVYRAYIQADGTVRGRQRNAVSNTAALQSGVGATPIVADTWYRFDYAIVPGAGVGDGVYKWRICLQNSNTPLTGMNISVSNLDAGITPIIDAQVVCPENHTLAGSMSSDDHRWNDTAGGTLLNAFVAPTNTPPTVAAITKVLRTQGQTVSGTMVPTDSDGTIAAYQWRPLSWPAGAATPTLTNATTATFTSNALVVPGIYTFGAMAQDNGGLWSPEVIFRVGVAASDSTAAVRGIRSNPGGYSGTVDDLNDNSSATGMTSPNGPAGAVVTLDMDPIATTDVSFDFFEADLEPNSTGTSCTVVLDVISGTGTTVAATRTFTITDTPTNRPITLTTGENTALADRIDWAVRLTSTQI